MPTQQYFNGAYMEETVHDLTTKIRQKKSMTCTNKEEVEGSFNLTKPGNNNIHIFFYSNISEFGGNLEGMLDEGRCRNTVQNMHKIGWKAQFSSLLMFPCWVRVVAFHNILSFMIQINNKSNVITSICVTITR